MIVTSEKCIFDEKNVKATNIMITHDDNSTLLH